jgi:hypothetical protein
MFEIAEYVLPRFSVDLSLPDTISMEDAADGLAGEIGGVFTHGNAVVGKAVRAPPPSPLSVCMSICLFLSLSLSLSLYFTLSVHAAAP